MTSFAPSDVNYCFLIMKMKLYLHLYSVKRKDGRRQLSPLPQASVPSTSVRQGATWPAMIDRLCPWVKKRSVEMAETHYLCPSSGSWIGPCVCPTNSALSFVLGTKKSKDPDQVCRWQVGRMVLMGECVSSTPLGVTVPETNTSLCSGPRGYHCSQITGEKKGRHQAGTAVSGATCQMCFHPALI